MEPNLGDVKMACEIGKVGRRKHIWVKCPMCTQERWAIKTSYSAEGTTRLCRECVIVKAKRSFKIRNS